MIKQFEREQNIRDRKVAAKVYTGQKKMQYTPIKQIIKNKKFANSSVIADHDNDLTSLLLGDLSVDGQLNEDDLQKKRQSVAQINFKPNIQN